MNKKRRERIEFSHPQNNQLNTSQEAENLSQADEMIDLNDINLQDNSEKRIVFKKYPCAMWIVGTIIIIIALFSFYHIVLGFLGTVTEGYREGNWWQFLVVFALLFLAGIFLYAANIESVIFDKENNEFSRKKVNSF